MDTSSQQCWQSSGSGYTCFWGGQSWTLSLDGASPGLARSDSPTGLILAMEGLGATGRRELDVFMERNLTSVAVNRARVQASYRPPGWGDLEVRASWDLAPDGKSVDLEVQASAASVGELRAVEVFVRSSPGWGEELFDAKTRYMVQPGNRPSAAMSYDGREPSEMLYQLFTTGVPRPGSREPEPIVLETGWNDFPGRFLEIVHPDDLSRRIAMRGKRPPGKHGHAVASRTALFGHDLEKGVVIRGRLRGRWLEPSQDPDNAPVLQEFARFLEIPPPLGT